MQKIKIFLASSAELKDDREQFEIFINRQNKQLADKGIFLHLEIWEDFIEAMSQTRLQDEYNKAIENCDVFLMLFFTKVGPYTLEEFEKAFGKFKKTSKPLIYTFFKKASINIGDIGEEINTLFSFQKKLKELKHFQSFYKNTEDLLHQFDEQLKKLKVYEKREEHIALENKKKTIELTVIPKHDDEFIGREEDLVRLETELQTSQKIVLMNGLGGIGKTTLAKKFVQNHLGKYDHVAWIEVKSQDTGYEQNMTVTEAFGYDEVLSKSLKLEFTNETNEARFNLIINALSNLPGKNLLVIDNAREDLNKREIKDILPRPPHWNILVTSRNTFNGFKTIGVDKLSKEQAIKLFQTHYTKTADQKDIEELIREIDYHTLTIELLAKTLAYPGQKLTIKEAHQKIHDRELFSPDLQRKIESSHSREETVVYIHLIQTFNFSPLTETEQWLMKQFCFLLPVSYSIEQLENFLAPENNERKKELHESLYTLSSKGWLQLNENNYSIHRVVQQMADYQLQPSLKDTRQLIDRLVDLLTIDAYTNVTKLFYLVPYTELVLSKLNENEIKDPLISTLQNNLGTVNRELGQDEKAKILLELSLKNDIENFGESHPTVAIVQSNLAIVYKNLGDYQKAKELLELALENGIKNFGEDRPAVALRQSNLALVYKNLGDYQKAKELLELTLENGIKNFGEDHPTVAIRRSNLATVYQDLGDYQKAKELLDLALENDIKNLGDDHPVVSIRRANLALVYKDLGDYQKAKKLMELALENNIKNLGNDHPSLAIYQWNLSSIHQDLGDYIEAKELLEKAYKNRMKNLGADHPKTKIIVEKLEELNEYLNK
jgi:tetratricopeptide (TPR) repeat protein/GTPase SAR1 family protein